MSATDAGDTSEILKCLSLGAHAEAKNLKDLAGGAVGEETKRENRYDSITKQPDEDEQAFEARRREMENAGSTQFNAQEVEEVVFECINCGS